MKRWIQIDDEEVKTPYVHQEFPQVVHTEDGTVIEVKSKKERDALKVNWGASPGGPFDRVPMPVPKPKDDD